jgi:hypothetical protein
MLQDLVAIPQKFCYIKEACGYAKFIHKKSIGKMDKCLKYLNQWVFRCPPKKRDEYDSPCVLAKLFPSFKREICFRGVK